MHRFPLFLAFASALIAPAVALDCKQASDQMSLNRCADADFKAADAELNAVYGQVTARLVHAAAPDAKTLLVSAQRSWVGFRDAECAFRSSDSEGGSMHPMVELGCRTELTKTRTAALRRYLACKPEDGDCPTGAP